MSSIKEEAVAWVKDYFKKNGDENTKVVIGISGGKDSSTVAALCCEALGKERVVGVLMPNGVQKDIDDSNALCDFLGIKRYVVNIADGFNGVTSSITKSLGISETTPQFNTNTPARLRMVTLYGVAAMLGNARISCNGNLSERLAGFFTLWGDGAGDFAPLAYLFVDEVVQLGLDLGLPEYLVRKAPSDGMCGMTDEDKLGFTYAELKNAVLGKTSGIEPSKVELISKKIKSMAFKRKLLNLPCFVPSDKKPSDW